MPTQNPAHTRATELIIRPIRGIEEYPTLVRIWHSAVTATHDFVAKDHLNDIEKNLATDYFPAVEILVAERQQEAVGFAGILNGSLEMLFVLAKEHGTGIGSALLESSISHKQVTRVDVNEQNPAALSFYLHRGFKQIGRSDLDGAGLPYPLLHLELCTPRSPATP